MRKKWVIFTHGVPDDYFKIKESIPFTLGRKPNPFDQQENRKICELGSAVVEKIFGKNVDPVGKEVRVNGVVMKVVGVFHDMGNRGRDSERIYIPDTTYQKVFGNEQSRTNYLGSPYRGCRWFCG